MYHFVDSSLDADFIIAYQTLTSTMNSNVFYEAGATQTEFTWNSVYFVTLEQILCPVFLFLFLFCFQAFIHIVLRKEGP